MDSRLASPGKPAGALQVALCSLNMLRHSSVLSNRSTILSRGPEACKTVLISMSLSALLCSALLADGQLIWPPI